MRQTSDKRDDRDRMKKHTEKKNQMHGTQNKTAEAKFKAAAREETKGGERMSGVTDLHKKTKERDKDKACAQGEITQRPE